MARVLRAKTIALILANLLLPVAVLIFASGFFPYKPVLPGLASLQDGFIGEEPLDLPDAIFDRVIFMIVDALRSDFVYGYESGFGFTQNLIRTGAAIPFTAYATPPTVTMPRVKALTTGSVPSFLDLILNFAESDTSSALSSQDTWLAQIRANGGNLVFYGDDTWLKLFPDADFFFRAEGTTSFFVSDFTEVDNNVTRHVLPELMRSDWNAMIMHYLGLDHIGHKTGPQGPNMLPKQKEMDDIVKSIYEVVEKEEHHRKTLLIIAGDHGMNAGGNHGGSGPGETEPALLFASPLFKDMEKAKTYECPTGPKEGTEFHYYTKIEQTDLVPTLAGMMGVPIPRNSVGISLTELNGLWSPPQALQHLRRNAAQMRQIIDAVYGSDSFRAKVDQYKIQKPSISSNECARKPEGEEELACRWACVEADQGRAHEQQQETITGFLKNAQVSLSGTASSYNIMNMSIGIALSIGILLLALFSFPETWPPNTASVFLVLLSILYGAMMFASSYVEEEQQFWYWLTPAWIILLALKSSSETADTQRKFGIALAASVLLAVHRCALRWNQTGQKHAGEPDIVHSVFPDAHVFMWLLILGTYAYNGALLVRRSFAGIMPTEMAVLLAVALVIPGIVFKLNFTHADAPELVQGLALHLRTWTASFSLVLQARVIFFALALATILSIVLSTMSARASARAGWKIRGVLPTLSERLHHLLTVFLVTQTRAPNVPLFLALEIQRQALAYILRLRYPGARRSVLPVAITTLLLSHVYFFCMAGSNSISSIDLSNAYNGVADYNIVAVGVLLFASNWAAPIWWCSAAHLLLATTAAPAPARTDERSWIDNERAELHNDTVNTVKGTQNSSQITETRARNLWPIYLSTMTAFIAASLLAVMAACTALRTHLFVWTVFSPKYLYAAAWGVGWHLIVNVGFGGAMSWAASVA